MQKLTFLVVSAIFLFAVPCLAGNDAFTQKDRELLIRLDERLNLIDKRFEQIDKRFEQMEKRFELMEQQIANLREDMNNRFRQVDKRFEQVDKRFEQMDKRFEQVDKRFEQMNKRFEMMMYLMMSIVGAFAAIVAVAIGFAVWDRRTMIRPFEDKVKKIETDITEDRDKIRRLIDAFRKLAQKDPKVAEILKSFSLL